MKPWQLAKQWLERWPDSVRFEEMLASCIQYGFVYSSDTSFCLAQQCYWDGHKPFFLTDRHNGWFAHLASGNLKDILLKAPHALEHVVFQRHGLDKYHAYNYHKLKEKYGIKI